MRSLSAFALATLALASIVPSAFAQDPAPQPAKDPVPPAPAKAEPRFATAIGGKLLGLPDAAAPSIRDLKAGEPLVVVGRQGALYEVEVPGGLAAWIYASYVRDGKEPGTIETIENGVNLRPRPVSDTRSLPIARASKGQVFVAVGREGDWVQVAAPEEIHGYVLASDVSLTTDPPSARRAEIEAGRRWVDDLRTKAAEQAKVRAAEEEKRKIDEEKRREAARIESDAVSKARSAMDLLQGATPDASARREAAALLDAAAQLSKSAAVAAAVQHGRERIEAVEFFERERREENERQEAERIARREEAERRMKAAQEILDRQSVTERVDPFGARFAGLGILAQGVEIGRGRVYTLRKGDRLLYYLRCPSGRYDLANFVGSEVGLLGVVKQVEGYPARMIEIDQIEVLSR